MSTREFTREELEQKLSKAVAMYENFGDGEKADEFSNMSIAEYASRNGYTIKNPHRGVFEMTQESKAELLLRLSALKQEVESLEDENTELAEQNDLLNERLNEIFTMASPEGDEDDPDAGSDNLSDEDESDTDE